MDSSARLRVVVCGAGVAGMTTSLALARLGHHVVLVDRDVAVRPAQVGDAASWKRPGVAQFHQPHAFLARICSELLADLPDVVDDLRAAGAVDVALPDGLRSFWCRRSTLEWTLRRQVEAEPGINVRLDAVTRVEAERGAVTGVRLGGSGLHPADLVVDCGGRSSRLTAELVGEQTFSEPANEVYRSRRYRMRPGRRMPSVNRGVIGVDESDGYATLVFPHDAGIFTLTFVHLPEDRTLAALRAVPVFEAAARFVPLGAAWTDLDFAEPISDIMVMSGLRNVFRPLHPAAPLGLHAIGDVVCTTNPHFGRGSSLAVAHALTLTRAVAEDPGDRELWRTKVNVWAHDELWGWFDDARSLDGARTAAWRSVMGGGVPVIPRMSPSPDVLPQIMVLAAAGADPEIARMVLRHMHMADPPGRLREVEPRVLDLLAGGWRPSRPPGIPTRAELVDAISVVGAPAT
ncbi:FAD-dependent oxidoreductase [Frankia sp. Cppng1_Ct_nod]|uniref:NAD(P)/FAD-dependent oxidoreductase n=1 Tax=Frankia sp. Cppng1_Ct_nod TaxID=2897162 RepID=UPI0020254190|nr:FAD-dependent oxidoreductase [Frankia sp. Cppng1_Ct_nod]